MPDVTPGEQALAERRERWTADIVTGGAITAYQPTDFGSLVKAAELLAKSDLVPKGLRGKAADVLFVLMHGAEMGLPAIQALQVLHPINGRLTMAADLMEALVRRSGKCLYFRLVEATDEQATYATARQDDPETERRCTFTFAEAQRAGLTEKDNWRNWRRDMLQARAQARICREVYPDVLAGVYSTEELVDAPELAEEPEAQPIIPERGESKAQALVRARRAPKAEKRAEIEAAVEEIFGPDESAGGEGGGEGVPPAVAKAAVPPPADIPTKEIASSELRDECLRRLRAANVTEELTPVVHFIREHALTLLADDYLTVSDTYKKRLKALEKR